MAEWAYDYSEGSSVQRHLEGLVFKVKKGYMEDFKTPYTT